MSARSRMKDTVFMEIASMLGELGTCDRKRVGAVIVRDGRCISWGYNGAPPGRPHCDENHHGWGFPGASGLENQGCINATHAELNAVSFAARQGIPTDGGTLYVTLSPCDVCSRALVAAGIIRVAYSEKYRSHIGENILLAAGIQVDFV